MNSRIVGTVVAGLVLSACGGGSGSDRGEAVDRFVETMKGDGVEVDRACAEQVIEKLSDADVQAIIDGSNSGDAQLSPAGDELASQLLNCVDTSSLISDDLIDQIVAAAGDSVDADCIRDAIGDLDLSNPNDPEVAKAMIECVNQGG
jgi:hypothetical protein